MKKIKPLFLFITIAFTLPFAFAGCSGGGGSGDSGGEDSGLTYSKVTIPVQVDESNADDISRWGLCSRINWRRHDGFKCRSGDRVLSYL